MSIWQGKELFSRSRLSCTLLYLPKDSASLILMSRLESALLSSKCFPLILGRIDNSIYRAGNSNFLDAYHMRYMNRYMKKLLGYLLGAFWNLI
jgi:hypothetical protein